jgi:hypothetical protein
MRHKAFFAVLAAAAAILIATPAAAGEKGRIRCRLDLTGGGGPMGSVGPAGKAGFEIGLHFPGAWSVAAGVSYGALALKTSGTLSSAYTISETRTWRDWPIFAMLRYERPIANRVAVSLGAGISYHSLIQAVDSQSVSNGLTQSLAEESSSHAWTPRAEVGIEIGLGRWVSLLGGSGYEFGTAKARSTLGEIGVDQRFNVGGPSLFLGLRLYLTAAPASRTKP